MRVHAHARVCPVRDRSFIAKLTASATLKPSLKPKWKAEESTRTKVPSVCLAVLTGMPCARNVDGAMSVALWHVRACGHSRAAGEPFARSSLLQLPRPLGLLAMQARRARRSGDFDGSLPRTTSRTAKVCVSVFDIVFSISLSFFRNSRGYIFPVLWFKVIWPSFDARI